MSAVYSRPFSETPNKDAQEKGSISEAMGASSKGFNPITFITHEKTYAKPDIKEPKLMGIEEGKQTTVFKEPEPPKLNEQPCSSNLKSSSSSNTSMTAEQLERRLNIEEEVTFVSKTISIYTTKIYLSIYLLPG